MSISGCSSKRKSVIMAGKLDVLAKKPRAPATIVANIKNVNIKNAQDLATATGNENSLTGVKNPPITTELKTAHFHVWSQVEVNSGQSTRTYHPVAILYALRVIQVMVDEDEDEADDYSDIGNCRILTF
jgi:hypothetical protein